MKLPLTNENKQSMKKVIFWNRATSLYVLMVISILLSIFTGIKSTIRNNLEIVIDSDAKSFQLFYDSGKGFSQKESIVSTTKFSIPDKKIRQIRIDPLPAGNKKTVTIRGIKFANYQYEKTYIKEELSNFLIPYFQVSKNVLHTNKTTTKINLEGDDPQLLLNYSISELAKITTPQKGISKNGYLTLFFISLLLSISLLWVKFRKKIAAFFPKLNQFIDEVPIDIADQSLTTKKQTTRSTFYDLFTADSVYWLLFIIASISYIALYSGSSVNLITWANYDDLLYFSQAKSIIEGNWLGTYTPITLAKVPGYAIFLAVCMFFRIPYLLLISLCNTIAIAFLLKKSMWLFNKARFLSVLFGVVLLFSPFFNGELRIYRNQVAAIAFTVFLAVLIGLFNPSTKKESGVMKCIQAIIAFVGFGMLFYTRDESILYYGILFLAFLLFMLVYKKITYLRRNLYLLASGILGITFMWLTISALNYANYGRFITCERTSAPFTTVLQTFHTVDDPDLNTLYPKSTATREKVINVAKYAPSFSDVAKQLSAPPAAIAGYVNASTFLDRTDFQFKNIDKNDLPTSHFEWFWIQCTNIAGHYSSATMAANYYNILDHEMKKAIKEGHLKKRKIVCSFGPYILTKDDIQIIFKILPKNYFHLLPAPKGVIAVYKNYTQRVGIVNNTNENLTEWKNSLQVNYLHPEDKTSIELARNSLSNRFWNFWIKVFAYSIIPLLHVVLPLTLISIVISLVKKNWFTTSILILITASFVANFLLLAIIDVTAGYRASSIPYYLPAYASLISGAFISISTLVGSIKNMLFNILKTIH